MINHSSYLLPELKYMIFHILTCIVHHQRVYYELILSTAPISLRSFVRIQFRSEFFQALFHNCLSCKWLRWSLVSSWVYIGFVFSVSLSWLFWITGYTIKEHISHSLKKRTLGIFKRSLQANLDWYIASFACTKRAMNFVVHSYFMP